MRKNRVGARLPGYVACSLVALFAEYTSQMVGRSFSDPLGTNVWFLELNFCKLVQLQWRDARIGQFRKAKATHIIPNLKDRTFREEDYRWDLSRAQSLLWLPDIIQNPDSIHANTHEGIAGDTVYVKRYAKAGASYKVVFTKVDQTTRSRIVTTSFWVPEDRLQRFIGTEILWEKRKAAVASGPSAPVTPGPGRRSDSH